MAHLPGAAQPHQAETAPGAAPLSASQRHAGRPEKPAEEKRLFRVNVSLTSREQLQWAAAAGTQKLSAWVRDVVNAQLGRAADERDGRTGWADEIAAVRAELRKIGTNVNQIARALNVEAKGGPTVNRDAIAHVLSETAQAQRELRIALSRLEGTAK